MFFEKLLTTVTIHLCVCLHGLVSYDQMANYESSVNLYKEHMNINLDNNSCKRPDSDNLSNVSFAVTDSATIDIRGLYFSEEEHNEILEKDEETGQTATDGDRCCETKRCRRKYTYLPDIRGKLRKLAVLGQKHQHIPHVECKNVGCKGNCRPESVTIQLLVQKEWSSPTCSNLEFASFSVPMYCSCKNSMTNRTQPLHLNERSPKRR